MSRHRFSLCRWLFLSLLFAGAAALCAPLQDIPSRLTQPDGSSVPCRLSGDEFFNVAEDRNGYTLVQDSSNGWWVYAAKQDGRLVPTKHRAGSADPKRLGLAPHLRPEPRVLEAQRSQRARRTASSGLTPRSGAVNNLVVFVRFADEAEFPEGQSAFEPLFNGVPGTSSLRNYYREVSYGKLDVTSTLVPATPDGSVLSYQDSHPRGYYLPYNGVTNPDGYVSDQVEREAELVGEALAWAGSHLPAGLNLDSDGDGTVDHATLIVRGSPAAWSDILWPHKGALAISPVTVGSWVSGNYDIQMESAMLSGDVGALCHEFFHALGAPDLYHYAYDGVDPVGRFDLMAMPANPPQHMGAYMKWKYGGWLNVPPEIYRSGTYTLSPLASSTDCWAEVKSPASATEYFVLEYRRKAGLFDASVLGSGLLVYRINTKTSGGDASGPPDEVYLYRPGGTRTVNGTLSFAPFSAEFGRTAMNSTTDPYPFLSNGTQGGLNLSDVGSAGDTISFTATIWTSMYQLAFTMPPGDGAPGLPLVQQPRLSIVDMYGKTGEVDGAPVTLSLEPGSGAAGARLLGTTTVGTKSGVAVFTDVAVDTAGFGYMLHASCPGLSDVVSPAFSTAGIGNTTTERVSVATGGAQSNGDATSVAFSADGNVIAFTDTGANLGGMFNYAEVYLRDLRTGVTKCASVAVSGIANYAQGDCYAPSLSADGRYVAFASVAANIVPGDTNGRQDVFWRDTVAGVTRRVSVASDGTQANGGSSSPCISEDGRYVVFTSDATNLVPNDTNAVRDVFLYDTQTNTIARVVASPDGTTKPSAGSPQLSGDGGFLVYTALGLEYALPPNSIPYVQVYRRDLATGETVCASLSPDGKGALGDCYYPSVSRDGRTIAFKTGARNLYPGHTYQGSQVFVRDMATGTLTCASVDAAGNPWSRIWGLPSLSADGTRVSFLAFTSLFPMTTSIIQVFAHDMLTGDTVLVSCSTGGQPAATNCDQAILSADGSRVAFITQADNLVQGDTNYYADVFLRGPLVFPSVTVADAVLTLRAAAGMARTNGLDTLARKSGIPPDALGIADAVRLLRRAVGG